MSVHASPAVCPSEEDLWLWVAGALSVDGAQAIKAHVLTCPTCAELTAANGLDLGNAKEAASAEEATVLQGRYQLGETLGRGASGVVRAALDKQLGQHVALKIFVGADPKKVVQELVIARRISHRNVCKVYDFGEAPGAVFLSMELVSGQTLGTCIESHGKSALPNAGAILDQVLAGLEAAHAQGVVHRDLKPQNILVDETGRVVLTDFGLARFSDAEQSREQLVGTPAYWAPEQARGEPATYASDVYAFGVIAYRLMTGHAFKLSEPAPFARLPQAYRKTVERCLEARPDARFVDASALRSAWQATKGQTESPTRPRSLAIAALAILGCGALLAYGLTRREPASKGHVASLNMAVVTSLPAPTAGRVEQAVPSASVSSISSSTSTSAANATGTARPKATLPAAVPIHKPASSTASGGTASPAPAPTPASTSLLFGQ
jgi:eukaryotic-like serine/threonine-protein kinase